MPRDPVTPADQVYHVKFQWSYTQYSSGESGWHFFIPAAAGDSRAILFDWVMELLVPSFIAARSVDWRLDTIVVSQIYPGVLAPLIVDVRIDPDPVGGGEGTPPQISPLISWRSTEIGRANRGRTFMGPYTTDAIEATNVQGLAFNACQDFAESMTENFDGLLAPLFGVYSRWEDGVPIDPGVFVPCPNFYFFGRWATQRRRFYYDWRT